MIANWLWAQFRDRLTFLVQLRRRTFIFSVNLLVSYYLYAVSDHLINRRPTSEAPLLLLPPEAAMAMKCAYLSSPYSNNRD
ncbi:hypothetical protein BDV12DRAFT_89256 [Aspergillus spectabilis]